MTNKTALVNSGATENFLDFQYGKSYRLGKLGSQNPLLSTMWMVLKIAGEKWNISAGSKYIIKIK
jgi:hypothetical protein